MALQIGDVAPDFEADTTEGRIKFHEWLGDGWGVLVSHPKDFTPVCTTELGAMAGIKHEFDKRNAKLIGISVDSKAALRAWAEEEGYDFTILADFWPHGAVAKEYGVFLDGKGFANRATFVIDENGIIRASFITAPGQARSVEEYRAALDEVRPVSV